MKRKILVTLSLLAALLAKAAAGPAPVDPSMDSKQILEGIRKKYNLPAIAVVVTKDGQIVDRATAGVRKLGDPTLVTTNDVFHIGSNTKSMTATLAAMLIEEHKLRWDTTIGEVFPDWKGAMNKQYEDVTVEQLMTHRGGVPGEPPADAWRTAWEEVGTPVEQREAFVKTVLSLPPEAKPGTKMIYSNQGYTILGAMLEKTTGTPWETLITERLFKPLHMDTAGFGAPGTPGAVDQPWGHSAKLAVVTPEQGDNPPAVSPAGRVHCSLDDLARYTMFHMQAGDAPQLLQPATLERLHTPPKGEHYACGWIVTKRGWAGGNALYHNGSNTMWYVIQWLAPAKKFSVVVGINLYNENINDAADAAAVAMIGKWLQKI